MLAVRWFAWHAQRRVSMETVLQYTSANNLHACLRRLSAALQAAQKKAEWSPGVYVRVFGHARCGNDQVLRITGFNVRTITDFNEVRMRLQCFWFVLLFDAVDAWRTCVLTAAASNEAARVPELLGAMFW